MSDAPYRRGDFVRVTAGGRTLDAMVGLASANGRSLILLFDGVLGGAVGGYVGAMPVLLHDDGVYRDLVNQSAITIERIRAH